MQPGKILNETTDIGGAATGYNSGTLGGRRDTIFLLPKRALSQLSFLSDVASFDLLGWEGKGKKGVSPNRWCEVKHESLSRLSFGNTDALGGRKVSVQSTGGNLALGRWLGLGILREDQAWEEFSVAGDGALGFVKIHVHFHLFCESEDWYFLSFE